MPSPLPPLPRPGARTVFLALAALLLGAPAVPLGAQTPPALVGDVNGDGAITAVDALGVLTHVVGRPLPAGYRVSPNGDNNRDGQITAADALLALSFAVGRDVSQYPVGKPIALVPPRTVVVDSMTLRLLSDSVQDTARILRFQPRPGAPTLAPGNVLVGEQGEGFLIHVDSVRSGAAGEVVVHGRPARLTEAVQEGWVRSSVRLGTGEGGSSSRVPADGAPLRPGEVRWGPSSVVYLADGVTVENGQIVLNDVVLREGDWGSWRIASGFVDFDPELDFGWEIKDWSLSEFHSVATGTLSYEARLDLRNEFEVDDDVKLVKLFSRKVPFRTLMGSVPVYGEWVMQVNLEVEGTARYRQRLMGGFRAEHALRTGVHYRSGEWTSEWEPTSSSSGLPFSREDEGEMNVRVSVKPTLQLVLYRMGGPRVFIEPYLDLNGRVNLTTGRWWRSATAGMEWGLGTSFPLIPGLFSLDYPNVEKEWTIDSIQVYADSGDLELDSVRIAQRTPRVSPGGRAQLTLLRYWGDELVQFGAPAQWTSSDPTLLGMGPDGTAQAGPNKGSGQVMVEVPIGPDKVLRDAVPVEVADPGDDDDDDGGGGEEPEVPPCNSCGDVHIRTPDGLAYDFQGAGEYLLMRSSDGSVVVQARQEPWRDSDRVSVNTAVAMNVAGDRVAVYAHPSPRLYINGVVAASPDGRIALPNGGVVTVAGGADFRVRWPNGFQVSAFAYGPWINIGMSRPAGAALSYAGMLGNMNGDPDDDLFTRSGVAVPQPVEFQALYEVFGASWQITQAESLFDYAAGESVATFARPEFPGVPLAVEDLDADAFAAARGTCLAAGVTDPVVLNDCILDIGATGNSAFVQGAAGAPAPERTVTVEFPDGLVGQYYAGDFAREPNFYTADRLSFFDTRSPVYSRVDNPIDFVEWAGVTSNWRVDSIPGLAGHDAFTIVWKGRLIVPRTGTYHVRLSSWGPSYLFMDSTADDLAKSNTVVTDYWFGRGYEPLELTAGEHPITIVYAAYKGSGSYVNLSWYSPDLGLPQPELITSLGRRIESPPPSSEPVVGHRR